jgi:flagellar biosynthesis GTPase FlhF
MGTNKLSVATMAEHRDDLAEVNPRNIILTKLEETRKIVEEYIRAR